MVQRLLCELLMVILLECSRVSKYCVVDVFKLLKTFILLLSGRRVGNLFGFLWCLLLRRLNLCGKGLYFLLIIPYSR